MTNIPKFELDPEVDFCFNNNTLEHVIIENQDGKPIFIVEPFKKSITHLKVPSIKALVKLPKWQSYDDSIFQFQI